MIRKLQALILVVLVFGYIFMINCYCHNYKKPLGYIMHNIITDCRLRMEPFYLRHGFFAVDWEKLVGGSSDEPARNNLYDMISFYERKNVDSINELHNKLKSALVKSTCTGRIWDMNMVYNDRNYRCKVTIRNGGLDYYKISTWNSEESSDHYAFANRYDTAAKWGRVLTEENTADKHPQNFTNEQIINKIFTEKERLARQVNIDYLIKEKDETLYSTWRWWQGNIKSNLAKIGYLKDKKQKDNVAILLSEQYEEEIRCLSIWAIGQIGLPEYSPRLKELYYNEKSINIRLNTIISINVLDEDVDNSIEIIKEGLESQNSFTIIYAIEALSTTNENEKYKLEIFTKLLRHPDTDVRIATIIALSKLHKPEILKIISKGLMTSDYETTHAAEVTLTKLSNQSFNIGLTRNWQNEKNWNADKLKLYSFWEEWLEQNVKYLYWSDETKQFVIDQEAKAAKIPTDEYRQTHPWPKEPDKSDGK